MEVTEPLLQIPVTKVIHTELIVISILVLNCDQLLMYINLYSHLVDGLKVV